VVKERFCMVMKNAGADVDSFSGSYHAGGKFNES
jgi:hypothetical protein